MSYVTVTYEYECFRRDCDNTEKFMWEWVEGCSFPEPTPPDGWVELASHYICPKHDVTLIIDDLEVDIS